MNWSRNGAKRELKQLAESIAAEPDILWKMRTYDEDPKHILDIVEDLSKITKTSLG